ncbi:unnamed protein product [Acanthosepion pharaonis]|uniref:C2 domain-containing protein n=1 Tax=Acanthosepion pharaonis TaxID=158019 RepID=A0A812D897_ACAPH|nr:unnamed protein product [Sepia pharaonis]
MFEIMPKAAATKGLLTIRPCVLYVLLTFVTLTGPVQIKIEKLDAGSPPPAISDIQYETFTDNEDSLLVKYFSDTKNLSFSVFASQKSQSGIKLTNCTCKVARYQAKVKLLFKNIHGQIKVTSNFDGLPLAKVKVLPVNPYQESEEIVDLGVVEEVVRNSLCLASATMNLSTYLGLSNNIFSPTDYDFEPQLDIAEIKALTAVQPGRMSQTQHALPFKEMPALPAPPKPPRAIGDKRLLIKIIKGSNLGGREEGSSDPFCVIVMDCPPQKYETTVIKNTVNPFWDEHFLVDVSHMSRELRFELYDKGKSPADEFLGEATIYMEDIRKTMSCRQIIPLQTPGSMEYQVGSLTVEFLLMEPHEADQYMDSSLGPKNLGNNQISPRKHVEVSRTVTPSGTIVTTTTTTTERPQFSGMASGSPSMIEKRSTHLEVENSDSVSHLSPTHLPQPDTPGSSGALPGFWEVTPTIDSTPTDDNIESPSSASADKSQTGSTISEKEDINGITLEVPPIKKSSSLGGSLKKLFRRGRKRTRDVGETSRESSLSRSSMRYPVSSREGSIDSRRTPQAHSPVS